MARPSATSTSQATRAAETVRERARAVAGHGLRAPPATTATTTSATTSSAATTTATTEVIHTTANHPWLSADHGWELAGNLQVGEPVRLLDGGMATVVALRMLPSVGLMWDLSLDATHTFAVGDVQAVVHNCPDPKETWTSKPNSLQNHFVKHGADFGATSPEDYAQKASDFLKYSQEQDLETLITKDGSIMTYDPATNTFGAYNADGTTQTLFKPSRGAAYWAEQFGRFGAHPPVLLP